MSIKNETYAEEYIYKALHQSSLRLSLLRNSVDTTLGSIYKRWGG